MDVECGGVQMTSTKGPIAAIALVFCMLVVGWLAFGGRERVCKIEFFWMKLEFVCAGTPAPALSAPSRVTPNVPKRTWIPNPATPPPPGSNEKSPPRPDCFVER